MIRFRQYLSSIAKANTLGDNVEWLFYPGMLQDSWKKWWDDFAMRHAAHEGIDICFFRTRSKEIGRLDKNAPIPAMDKGIVLNIADDFLGQTLVMAKEKPGTFFPKLIFVYSHLKIEKDLVPGDRVKKGQIIGQVFDTSQKPSKLFPHLHLSCIELMQKIPFNELDWNLFSDRENVNLINPVFI
jgi:hypothetical protein